MNESLKAICQLIAIISGLAAIAVWPISPQGHSTLIWTLRIACPILFALTVWPLILDGHRPNVIPDKLREYVREPQFTRDGLVFTLTSSVRDRYFEWNVFFQNYRDRHCEAVVLIQQYALARSFRLPSVDKRLTVRIPIRCDGGAVGRATACLAMPREYQGKENSFEVYASVRYPNGAGRQLRKVDALRVGKAKVDWKTSPSTPWLSQVRSVDSSP